MKDLLAPLAPTDPTDHEIATLLAHADRRTRRRRYKLASGAALATVALTATLAALPGGEKTALPASASAAELLRATAGVAADQSGPADWTGYRYVQDVELQTQRGYTLERTEEIWTDSDWQGRRVSPEAKVIEGTIPPAHPPGELPAAIEKKVREGAGDQLTPEQMKTVREAMALSEPDPKSVLAARDIRTPGSMPNLYGDGPLAKVPLSELPTDPQQLGTLLIEAHQDGRWTPGGSWDPLPQGIKYAVLRDILLLLTQANATSQQRAALITVLTEYEGATPLPVVKDHRGREGRGVDIPAGDKLVRVIFSPDTSELLEWSEPNEVHTYLTSGHVAEIGDRP
jgi:hypothetical protein